MADNNVGSQGCVARPGSIFDDPHTSPIFVSLEGTLANRGATYGDYGNMAHVAQTIKEVLRSAHAWQFVNAAQRESLDVIATKMARIVCGDPNHRDSWHDIQGYAKLVEDRLPARAVATP